MFYVFVHKFVLCLYLQKFMFCVSITEIHLCFYLQKLTFYVSIYRSSYSMFLSTESEQQNSYHSQIHISAYGKVEGTFYTKVISFP